VKNVAAIVLAAGRSRRFGSPKQLVKIEGRSLVRRAVDAALSAGCHPTVAVLGARAEEVAAELTGTGADLVVNARWEEGMASSIRAGIGRLRETAPSAAAVIVLLADQPHVSESLLRSLAERLGLQSAAACRYEGVLGPPAIFSATLFDRLEALTGDEGARCLLRSGDLSVAAIDFPAGALDIDAPGDP
jgi:molybdenum cofactor cytidylyltransferase